MQNIESFLEKNPTLYKCLLNNANVYPEEVKFYTDNAPRTVETYNAVSDELENILNKHTQLSLEEKINIHNEYMDLVNGMNIEERDFNFLYGLKVGAKMMIELLQD